MDWQAHIWTDQIAKVMNGILKDGEYKCGYCKGTGFTPRTHTKCPICRGEGTNKIEGSVIKCAFCRGSGKFNC